MICMHKIAVIGRQETVIGFKALGLEAFSAADAAEAGEVLDMLTREESQYAIIYIEESFAEKLQNVIGRYKDSPTPAIIVIPGRDGSTGMGLSALNSAVERAVGMNILDKE